MSFDPHRHPEPAAGYHRITAERRFMYLQQDPEHTLRVVWQTLPVTCPMCTVDTGLTLAYERGVDETVQALCPAGHLWHEHLIDTTHFTTYSELQFYADPDPEMLWIIDAGFGEEAPPPIDYVGDITGAAKYVARYAKRKAKTRIRQAVRKPIRKAKKKALNLAFTPVAAALRATWAWQAGGMPDSAPKAKTERGKTEPELKIPSYAKYRAALGIPAPKKGPRCLVCEGAGHITAPGIRVTCTECAGPAAAAMAKAERKAERARNGSAHAARPAKPAEAGRRTREGGAKGKAGRPASTAVSRVNGGVQNVAGVRNTGVVQTIQVAGGREQVNVADASASAGRPLTAKEVDAVRDAVKAADRAVQAAGGRTSGGVHVADKNNSVITSVVNGDTVQVAGDG
ncbi:hypothetical protein [Streptomyces sp. NPDC002133]|uniref:hypothetical protein n=1 Tax=Streptomyces sp. NPDC002133 TaxID=3154409 RepID=UPI00332DEF6F